MTMTTTTTTIRIASNAMIYSIGFFRWIEECIMPFDDNKAREFLNALGIRSDMIEPILHGQYTKKADGETLILEIEQ